MPTSSQTPINVPPAEDELEVSLFGRGYGESAVIHLGFGKWMVVDSLLEKGHSSVPLLYLQQLGVDVSKDVVLIVATHWHDDHVQGLAELYQACPNAIMSFPTAMQAKEFKHFVEGASALGQSPAGYGMKELYDVMTTWKSDGRASPRLATDGKVLLSGELSDGHFVQIQALSPSDVDVTSFLLALGQNAGATPSPRLVSVMPFSQNDVSIALWVKIGPHAVLLGADLEQVAAPDRGWNAVIASPSKPQGTASIIKIPHHGSPNGHNKDVWQDMMGPEPIAILAPWTKGGHSIPKKGDVDRICALTPKAFSTNERPRRQFNSPVGVIQKQIDTHGVKMLSLTRVGHIRIRQKIGSAAGTEVIDPYNGACLLSQMAVT